MRDAQTDVPWPRGLRAQLAFKDSMVHGILQFTPSIAFRYVLHRCESRDIRCRESFNVIYDLVPPLHLANQLKKGTLVSMFLGADRAGVRYCAEKIPHRGGVPSQLRDGAFTTSPFMINMFSGRSAGQVSTMILPQVHLRKPCYDFSFL